MELWELLRCFFWTRKAVGSRIKVSVTFSFSFQEPNPSVSLALSFRYLSTTRGHQTPGSHTARSAQFSSVQLSSVAQSCRALGDPMDCSTPGFPVHHQLTELTQTHVHRIGDAIRPSYPLSSPSPPAFNLSQHQGLFQWVGAAPRRLVKQEFPLQKKKKEFPLQLLPRLQGRRPDCARDWMPTFPSCRPAPFLEQLS